MEDNIPVVGEFVACDHMENCGGCSYQGISYENQLKDKVGAVKGLLKVAGMELQIPLPIYPCPTQYRYRNKMEYSFGDEIKDGPLVLGMHKQKNFMAITYAGNCQIVPEEFNEILKATLIFCTEKKYTFYHKKSHAGLLRNLIIRKGFRTGEILINIVTSSQTEFLSEEYKDLILNLECATSVVGILHTINDNIADAVICDDLIVLYGRSYYVEMILGLSFKVGAFSFFQTNVTAAERLYKDAISLIDSLEGKTVYDLYCGTGTITQAIAEKAKMAIGVEIDKDAVIAASQNAKINNMSNCHFITGDVLKVLDEIEHIPDLIVVDPPRSGIHPKAMEKICAYGVPQIVYISCNPKTLIQNIPTAQTNGYKVAHIAIYDNFPFTKHIEMLCLLEKEN